MTDFKISSYGAEHEWADHPLDRALPIDFGRDKKDITIVNSNGVANDPTGRTYRFGGEFNTPPTTDIKGQLDAMDRLKEVYPESTVNYRSNLHLHVHIPGLKHDLLALKLFQIHVHQYLPEVLAKIVEPIPVPTRQEYPVELEFLGAKRRFQRRRVSHQSFLTPKRLEYQAQAATIEEWFNREPPQEKETKKPLFHLQPRLCVSLRQLLQTDTIEFRHFPGTMNREELRTCFNWVKAYTEHALEGMSINGLVDQARNWKFPTFPKYHYATEVKYRRTVHDGTLEFMEIHRAVREITRHESLEHARERMIREGYSKGVDS